MYRHKKDEFFMNKKRIQKAEVISLLETAGFSRTNPYYIVQQGRVANLCTMKDRDRLMLLKEVSGTSVYEDRRAESLKILQESGVQQERIDVRYALPFRVHCFCLVVLIKMIGGSITMLYILPCLCII